MAYADKCFYFDWGNREIKLQDFDCFDSISVRKRWYQKEEGESKTGVSIELWGKEKEDSEERYEDHEILLSKDDAMVLASKLTRAVAELDAEDYNENSQRLLWNIEELHYDELEKLYDKRRKIGYKEETDIKGGIGGALENYLKTPKGKDAAKKIQ